MARKAKTVDGEPLNENEGEAKSNETRAEKFTRLAKTRTNKILNGIASLGKLSASAYDYTPEQVERMFNAINLACTNADAKFSPREKGDKPTFDF